MLNDDFNAFKASTLNNYSKQVKDMLMQGMLCFGVNETLSILNGFVDDISKCVTTVQSKH